MTYADNLETYLSRDEIDKIVTDLAKKISEDYATVVSHENPLVVIITLKGAIFFGADLIRKLDIPVLLEFVRLASYGTGTKSAGTVRMLKDLEKEPKGKHLLVLDEIADSGHTINFLLERLRHAQPASVKVCTLVNKASRREVDIPLDYIGKEVEDKFFVGYGMDFNEKYRNLKEICYIKGN